MTKEDILYRFKDINHAYNDCMAYDNLSRMLDDLISSSMTAGAALVTTGISEVYGKWIPVSERLPEAGVDVLCQCHANIFEVFALTPDGWYHDKEHCYMMGFVIAWMPLPEPYKDYWEK